MVYVATNEEVKVHGTTTHQSTDYRNIQMLVALSTSKIVKIEIFSLLFPKQVGCQNGKALIFKPIAMINQFKILNNQFSLKLRRLFDFTHIPKMEGGEWGARINKSSSRSILSANTRPHPELLAHQSNGEQPISHNQV